MSHESYSSALSTSYVFYHDEPTTPAARFKFLHEVAHVTPIGAALSAAKDLNYIQLAAAAVLVAVSTGLHWSVLLVLLAYAFRAFRYQDRAAMEGEIYADMQALVSLHDPAAATSVVKSMNVVWSDEIRRRYEQGLDVSSASADEMLYPGMRAIELRFRQDTIMRQLASLLSEYFGSNSRN